MKINIRGEKMELTEPIKNYIEDKINSLERFLNTDTANLMGHVIVGKTTDHHQKGNIFKAEANISSPIKIFFAQTEKDDLYAAIDEMQDILKRDMIKTKEVLIEEKQKAEEPEILENEDIDEE